MPNALAIPSPSGTLTTGSGFTLPAAIADQGEKAAERFFTFFTDNIPNPNTSAAYYRNAMRFFAWTHRRGLALRAIKSYHVSGLPGRTHADRQAAPRQLADAVRLADPGVEQLTPFETGLSFGDITCPEFGTGRVTRRLLLHASIGRLTGRGL